MSRPLYRASRTVETRICRHGGATSSSRDVSDANSSPSYAILKCIFWRSISSLEFESRVRGHLRGNRRFSFPEGIPASFRLRAFYRSFLVLNKFYIINVSLQTNIGSASNIPVGICEQEARKPLSLRLFVALGRRRTVNGRVRCS